MRFDAALASVLYSSSLFLGQARADVADDTVESSSTSVVESSTSSAIEKPTFTVSLSPTLDDRTHYLFSHLVAPIDKET